MDAQAMTALKAALDADPALRARFEAATSEAEIVALAQEAGIAIDRPEAQLVELSEAELASVSGGYTFPQTDWIYCDNPWTNAYCTLKC